MFVLSQKLKNLKVELHSWNKSVFGDVHRNVEQAQALLITYKLRGMSLGTMIFCSIRKKIPRWIYLRRFNIKRNFDVRNLVWHCSGDRNSAFFHKVTKVCHA